MKIILFSLGLILSVWVSIAVYPPVNNFVTGIQKVYLQSKAIERTIVQKSGNTINTITDAYKEISRVFGKEVAQETAKIEVIDPTRSGESDPIEQFFSHNIALWISVGCGLLTLSIYMNILTFIAFFLKPITFFMKK